MKPNLIVKSLLLVVLASNFVILHGQNDTIMSKEAKIDSILFLQKQMYHEIKNEPLIDKKYGVEVNLFRFLMIDKLTTFSGSFSYFNAKQNAEISFPIYFQIPNEKNDLTEFTLDCHYRYFLGNSLNGFYLSGFTRFAYLHGVLGNNDLFQDQTNREIGNEGKLGLGLGLGYRIFSSKGLYWGASLSIGRYLIGKNDRFSGSFLSLDDDEELIIDVELLKFGWAF